MANIKDEIAQAYTNKRATFTGDVIDVSAYRAGVAYLNADLLGAPTSPTIDIALQTSVDGTTFFPMPTAWAFGQKTADATEFKVIPADTFAKYIRFVYTIGGTGYADGTKAWETTVKLAMSK
jgi:hypothetical protein